MKSTLRLSIQKHADETVIRYQWCPTFFRYAIAVFLLLAVVILATDHGSHALTLREVTELTWAAMVLGLIAILAINSTEIRVTPQEVRVTYTPIGLIPQRTLPRSEIVSVHYWSYWRKTMRHKLSVQLAYPVHLGEFTSYDEPRIAAEAIAERLRVDCLGVRPNGKLDFVYLGFLMRIVACLAAPLLMLVVLHFLQM